MLDFSRDIMKLIEKQEKLKKKRGAGTSKRGNRFHEGVIVGIEETLKILLRRFTYL